MDSPFEKQFAEDFRTGLVAAREGAGMTPTQLAVAIGTSQAQVSRWESGLYVPKLYWIARLARGLRIEPSALIPAIPNQAESTEDQDHDRSTELGGEG